MGHRTVEDSSSASLDHVPALYAPYTWELSTPHRCFICGEETPIFPVKVWSVPHKREWACYRHIQWVKVIAGLNQSETMSDIVLEFRAKHLLEQKRCLTCLTKKDLTFFKPSGVGVLKASHRMIVDESDKWFALCPRHKHLRKSYCGK